MIYPCVKQRAIALILALAWAVSGVAAHASSLTGDIDALLAEPSLRHALVGVLVKSAKTGATLYERNADLALVPASTMKLLVSAAALDRLGPDYRSATTVYEAGSVASGALTGDIVIKGGGDPVLGMRDLENLAQKIRDAGIRKVTGAVVVDDTLFDNARLGSGWCWDYLSEDYAAETSALNFNKNVVDVFVLPGDRLGAEARVKTAPATDYVIIQNAAVTGEAASRKSLIVDRELGGNVIRVRGSVPFDYKITKPEDSISVEAPALYAGHMLRDILNQTGVKMTGEVRHGTLPPAAKLIAAHSSPPLSDILRLMNKPSDNLIAEVLLKTLGAAKNGDGTAASGILLETEFLNGIGMDMGAVNIVDGSGLSRLNFISSRNLVTVLTGMLAHKRGDVFIASLPVAGVDGTLRGRMKNTSAAGKVKAKTGYVSGVSSICGYVNTQSGEMLVFSIIMNNHLSSNKSVEEIQDKICELLAEMP